MFHSMKMFVNAWKNNVVLAAGTGVMGLAFHDALTRDESKMDCKESMYYIPGVGPYPNMKTCVPKEVGDALKQSKNKA